ncbi:PQQ-binding-like beta-propeller repeat protein [Streptomyces sp. NBRC 110028]|uniref:outer membrane protein assembly factor BamB family protein n=1 Tax=Streptomyces sp. NBRC 110028 TaxID=1621260 RepID=UPI0006E36A49|nr:PQQ-binding-like beta-propeller repeat protein [Streptomyces sp. NBRC 110028]
MGKPNWRSHRSLGLSLVLVLAVGAGLTWWLTRGPDEYGERVSGPHGAYPSSRTGAPAAPGRFTRRVNDAVDIVDGLSFHLSGHTEKIHAQGLVARNLRTGKTYWHYKRDGKRIEAVRVAEGTAVLRYFDGPLIAVDMRSGRRRWYQDLPEERRSGDGLWIANGVVAMYTEGKLVAFDLKSGKRSWTAGVPRSCRLDRVRYIVPTAFGVEATCGGGPLAEDVVLGIDARRGTVRWRHPDWMGGLRYLNLTDHTVFAPYWRDNKHTAVIDVSGAEPTIRTAPNPDLDWDGQDGTVVTTTFGKEGKLWRGDNVLRARGAEDGRVRWTHHAPRDRRFGRTLVTEGRVYVVEQPQEDRDHKPEPGPTRLLVLDLASGKTLHTAPVPAPAHHDYVGTLDAWVVRDGVVAVAWDADTPYHDPVDFTVLGG